MKVIQSDLTLCEDCVSAAVNDDYTGLDYHYEPEKAAERMRQIEAGLKRLGPGLVPDFGTNMIRCTECDYRHTEDHFPFKPDDDGDGGECRTCPECFSQYLSPEGDGEDEFSHKECDCCGTTLAGSHVRFAILGEENEQATT